MIYEKLTTKNCQKTSERTMSLLQTFLQFIKSNPKFSKILTACLLFYVLKKLRDRQRYAQKQFKNRTELNKRAVLITGCDTGFGYQTAQTLHAIGFCVIATVLKQQSADKFNQTFNGINSSYAFVMDITELDQIIAVKHKVAQHLDANDKILWGLVNNAGMFSTVRTQKSSTKTK